MAITVPTGVVVGTTMLAEEKVNVTVAGVVPAICPQIAKDENGKKTIKIR
ncbi:hypothetical protein LOC54_06910 [Acetobacter sp. AN02]|nr:hypothetical protein [Acetobacter sp. AN02]MDG6094841.1 hypothetical protein [Acetobacter sp. AN02]